MKIGIAGYRGFLGQALIKSLPDVDWLLIPREALYGDSSTLKSYIEGAEVVVNFAGSSIAKRWTSRNRRKIINSRFAVNSLLVETINRLDKKPAVFITASATGYYDTSGVHDETSISAGNNFLSEVVKQWEEPLRQLDGSVIGVRARIGIVLGVKGGMFVTLLKIARYGILPVMGSGKQIYSFIHIDDLVQAIRFIIDKRTDGVYNLCSPYPVDNATFTRTLARFTGDPFMFRLPSFFINLGMGASYMMVTKGQHVLPARLSREGFIFRYPRISDAIQNLVKQH